ncbi:MAG: type II toxin-antitoxin system VapC family toxin [Terriglobales bacterium]
MYGVAYHDANVIAYYCVAGTFQHEAALALRGMHEWHSAELWCSELRNALAGYMRSRGLPLATAQSFWADAEQCMARSYRPPGSRVLELAASSGCSAYDLEYVALAQQLRAPLITMDREVLRAFPDEATPLI